VDVIETAKLHYKRVNFMMDESYPNKKEEIESQSPTQTHSSMPAF
jgi:hypothetical protein